MHNVEVEVVYAPVCELFLADWCHLVVVVEGIPEFGDEEEVAAFYEAVFDGAGNALAAFRFVAVVCCVRDTLEALVCKMYRGCGEGKCPWFEERNAPHAPSKRR